MSEDPYTWPEIRAPKADRRRAAYRARVAKHLDMLRAKDRRHGLIQADKEWRMWF